MSVEATDPSLAALPPELAEALTLGPFHRALALAIAESGLALSRVEWHLQNRGIRIGRSTLSYWQQGRRRPERPESIAALGVLEDILDLPPESLSGLLGPRKPRGRWIGHQTGGLGWAEMWGTSDEVRRLVAIDSRRISDRLRDVSISERIEIGADRRYQSLTVNTVAQAREDGADRTIILYNPEPDIDVTKVRITGLHNCRLGRHRTGQEGLFVANELLFDRSLADQDTHLFGFRLDMVEAHLSDAELTQHGIDRVDAVDGSRGFRRSVHSYVLEAQFNADMLPVRCYHVQAARFDGNQQIVRELILNAQHAVHVALQNVQPGVHGIRWEWD